MTNETLFNRLAPAIGFLVFLMAMECALAWLMLTGLKAHDAGVTASIGALGLVLCVFDIRYIIRTHRQHQEMVRLARRQRTVPKRIDPMARDPNSPTRRMRNAIFGVQADSPGPRSAVVTEETLRENQRRRDAREREQFEREVAQSKADWPTGPQRSTHWVVRDGRIVGQ